jgi:predicted nucleic acid-binding protein
MNTFVDSDILIEVLRARNDAIRIAWLSMARAGTTIIYSPVSSAEIWTGARPNEHEQTTRLFRPLLCVPITQEIGERAGEFMRLYGKSHNLKIADALIGASAVQNQANLWTLNRKHYPMPELSFY